MRLTRRPPQRFGVALPPSVCFATGVRRHLGLQTLSREHHHALVMARLLRTSVGNVTADVAQSLQAMWRTEVLPHFRVEERELLPLCHGHAGGVAEHADTVRADHKQLRALFDAAAADGFQNAVALGQKLEEHVRFEEQHWFPALEAALDEATLASLVWRLHPEPEVPATGFVQDANEPGAWVAQLACGHRQHVRHKPPFQNAAWVMTEDGRQQKLGAPFKCVLCQMPRLPPNATVYKETAVFDEHSVPQGLLSSHTLRADTWGKIVVLEGLVDYAIEGEAPIAFVLREGVDGVIAPEQPHHVKPHGGARFKVCFLRLPLTKTA